MTTLGAKPNHAFFNCQHPAPKKNARRCSGTPCARRESRRDRLRRARARSPSTPSRQKRNVVFKVVLSAKLCGRSHRESSRAPLRTTRRRQSPKDKRIASEIFPSRRFFAPHKPDCADLRELEKAIRTIRDASRARRNSVDDIHAGAFHRIEAGCDPLAWRSRRCVESSNRTDLRVAERGGGTPRGQRKSRPRSRGRLRQSLSACPMTRARPARRQVSGRLLPAVRRSRPGRADR